MDENKNPAGPKPSNISKHESILRSLNLEFFNPSKPEHIQLKCTKLAFLRGFIDIGLIVASAILAIFVLINISNCDDDTYDLNNIEAFMSVNFVLATLNKIGIFLIRLSSRAQKFINKKRFFFTKGIISLYYCSHMMPVLLVDTDDCKADHPFLDVRAGIVVAFSLHGMYLMLTIGTIVLCTIAHLGSSPYLSKLENIFKAFVKLAIGFIVLLTCFILIFAISDLYLNKPLVILEVSGFFYYFAWGIYYTLCNKVKSTETSATEEKNPSKPDKI
ncbi:unnamed protein product [Blepharisma stoltei]|uniref:Uncharacterized protein n=1 Tax=Blepharisma stoltei TaxID=1481888 RepID=A0AAU9IDS4_9CILI|nr:unnamed protein product [Blepharisma stoltei]